MQTGLSGTLYTLEDHFMYVGPLVPSAPHAHHAGQIMWVPDGVGLQSGDETPRRATFAVIRPRQTHAHGDASFAAVLWLDGDDARWALSEPLERTFPRALPEIAPLHSDLSASETQALARRLLEMFAPDGEPRRRSPHHPAVQRMRALLDAGSTTPSHELSLAQLARRSGLSERQLRAVFARDTGLSPRAYLRWRRLRRAVASIREGASLTRAAMQAGFADGPHFSRVFRAQFGMSPDRAFASLRFGDALSCPSSHAPASSR
jgi:AraC-like DNA-binding protein